MLQRTEGITAVAIEREASGDRRLGRGVIFQGNVSLGHIIVCVPLMAILGTAVLTSVQVGIAFQEVRGAIGQEVEARHSAQEALEKKVDALVLQQSRDILALTSRLGEMGQDIRLLVSASISSDKLPRR